MEYKFVTTRKTHQCPECRHVLGFGKDLRRSWFESGTRMLRVTYFAGETPEHRYYCAEHGLKRYKGLLLDDLLEWAADDAYELALKKKRAGEKVPRWWSKMLTTEELRACLERYSNDKDLPTEDAVAYVGEDWEAQLRKRCNSGGSTLED